jgi:hypothetical protein
MYGAHVVPPTKKEIRSRPDISEDYFTIRRWVQCDSRHERMMQKSGFGAQRQDGHEMVYNFFMLISWGKCGFIRSIVSHSQLDR